MMNCVQARKSCSTWVKRSMLASSSAASTSSSTQNGLGRLRKIASSSATQVSVFSPPLKQRDAPRLLARRPGDDLDAAVENVDVLLQHDVGVAAAEQVAEERLEMALDRLERLGEQPPAVGVDLVDDLFQRRLGRRQVLVLVGEGLVAGFELLEFFQGFEVDVAEIVDLLPQFVDFLLHLFPLVLLLVAGLVLQLGQLDAVVLAEPVGQAVPLVADFVGGQVGGVDLLFQLADLGRESSGPRPSARSAARGATSRWLTRSTVCAANDSLRR